jgi:NAD(P)-dependent dehydrogenase (short-subunit alcohol dehydrogenase family)
MPSLLITGASSGIGAATVKHFLHNGWRVFATMRNPSNPVFTAHPNLTLLPLDVTDAHSIAQCMQQLAQHTPTIDVLVNNAGYGLFGPLELATPEQIRHQFDTNVFGLIQMMQAVLPLMRQQGHGLIINVASIGGRTTFPLYSLYHGTKWAVEGLTESASYELASLGVQVKLIEPGPIKTDFYNRSMTVTGTEELIAASDYAAYMNRVQPKTMAFGAKAPGPEVVASTIWRAATDGKTTFRYPVNTLASLWLRRLLPEGVYRRVVRMLTHG